MTTTPHPRPDDRDALRHALIVWSVTFTLLFVALFRTAALADTQVALLDAFRFVIAIAVGQVVGRVGWRLRDVPAQKWWPAVAALLSIAGVTITSVDYLANWLVQPAPQPGMGPQAASMVENILRPAPFWVWVYGMTLLTVHMFLSRQRNRVQAAELADARAAAVQAQLAMLRYQLNPHFLFNTLNAISTLVITGRPAAAEEMLSKLSRFLRASLASEPGDFVTLDAELGMLQEYLEIEAIRFGDRLEVDFACDAPAAVMLVPSLILQPLVENAIKYAVGPSRRRVTIKLGAQLDGDDLVVTIADDGDGAKATTKGGTGVGLRNVRGRLAALYGTSAGLEAIPLENGFLAIVRLPATPATDVTPQETIVLAGVA